MWKSLLAAVPGLTYNADGTFSSTKTMQVIGFAFVTRWLTVLVYTDKFTEWYLLSYLVFPFGLRGLQTFANIRNGRSAEKSDGER
ncbi:hypothetical protein [uncultured Hydrogenophaga sp.]|uniref:hypothetical protein n=1 Tax=uncultured Hydrogenophaga sp. TaxID=199683 RepID=UPI00265DC04C|nr:hypothetical protein [uncultured Hydrogenophaga sp.]